MLVGMTSVLGQSGQAPPSVTEMPNTGSAPYKLRPKPDIHGRAQGTGQQHGNDTASPGGSGGSAPAGATGPAQNPSGAQSGATSPGG
jgi:hypothetical protein